MVVFFFSSRRRHTRWPRDWSSDVCSSDLLAPLLAQSATLPRRGDQNGGVQALWLLPGHRDSPRPTDVVDRAGPANQSVSATAGAGAAPGVVAGALGSRAPLPAMASLVGSTSASSSAGSSGTVWARSRLPGRIAAL